ncbi:MAG: AGE family epimerase/isomerase [Armatimonadetes bacterium]|nr:AGE family epimerase/isomerase [Armatimonadota bacterium]
MIRALKLTDMVVAVVVCAIVSCLPPVQGADKPWEPTGKETVAGLKARTSTINRPKVVGDYYKAAVPDTLDLAERASLGINHFTSIISEKDDYEMYWRADFDKSDNWAWPGYMWFQLSPLFACQAKALEAMAMCRVASGSQQHLERETRMMEMMVSHLGDDGLFYVVSSGGRKPWLGPEEKRPYANTHGQGRMIQAMMAWYQLTGDPAWKKRIDRLVDGLDRLMVVHKGDYAYIPTHGIMPEEYCRSCYVKGQGWKDTEEAKNEKDGEEGSLFCHQGHVPGALVAWYRLTGNKQALRLAGELVRFYITPKLWADWPAGEYPGVVGAEHAHWQGHYHGYVNALTSILDYAIATNDAHLKQFARDGYEWTRQAGLARIGLVGDGQGCGCGRLIGLAIKLSEAGVGDYWEDVDLYIRNQGTEAQFTPEDIPYLEKLIAKNPNPPTPPEMYSYFNLQNKNSQGQPPEVAADRVVGTNVNVMEAAMGGFTMSYLPYKTGWALCCSPWGNKGIFYAWDATLRYADGVARVNLLLNRASPWMDIDSYIPYEGKVVLRNKKSKEVFVRIPLYAEKNTVVCRIGDRKVKPEWFGRYLVIKNLKAGDVVTIEFPLEEKIERWTSPPPAYGWPTLPLPSGVIYTCRFKGNALIEISPALWPGTRLYEDRPAKYKSANAPMKKVTRYVSPIVIDW